ncbi:MAG TPA: hypothetical protein VHA09_07675 [Nitrososphaera sp.]|nr:hypothetical protein [Nitrososphaera sp.]
MQNFGSKSLQLRQTTTGWKAKRLASAALSVCGHEEAQAKQKALGKVAGKKRLMAKATAEEIIKEFISTTLVGIGKDDNDARKVCYHLTHNEEIDRARLEQAMAVNSAIVESGVTRLEKEYKDTSMDEKIVFTRWLLSLLFGTLNGYNLLAASMPELEGFYHIIDQEQVRRVCNVIESNVAIQT